MKKIIITLILIVIIFLTLFFIYNKNTLDSSMLNGHWQSYIDCPTEILIFEDDQKVTLKSCDSEYVENSGSSTSYRIIGNKAIAVFNGDKYEFTLDQNDINKLNVSNKVETVTFSKKIN